MALLKRGRGKRLVLDIGTSAIRMCEISQTKAGYQLTKYFQRELNIDPALTEEEKLEQTQDVLAALLKETKSRTRKTILAVPGQSVFTRNRPLPPVPEYKVPQIVRYEIQQQIPFSLDQIALDYHVLNRTEAGGYDVMMAAIKVDVVEKQLEAIKKSKRIVDVVDVSPIAAYNWLKHAGEFGDDGQCVAMIDIGATTTDIVIHKDDQFQFTRSLHVGGNDITNAIASSFNMSFADAERLKRERGFAPTGDPKRDGKGGEVIGRITSRLVSEINRSLSYYRSQPGGSQVTRIILTGGGSCLRNIVPYLQSQLNVEVRIAQPLASLAVAPGASEASEHPEQASVVLGLALRCNESVPIEVNLIPPRVLESALRRQQAFYWTLSIVTLLLIMLSIVPVTAAKVKLEEERIQQLQRVLVQYDPVLQNNPLIRSPFEDEFAFVSKDVNAYITEVTDLDDMRMNRRFWLPQLRAINNARPVGGGIAISSWETAVFGGANNTGYLAREALKEQAASSSTTEADAGDVTPELDYSGNKTISGFYGIKPKFSESAVLGASSNLLEPNGMVIYGYAADIDVLKRFVDRLKEQDMFVEGGVYFYVAFADDVPDSKLDMAMTEGFTASAAGRSRRADGGAGISLDLSGGGITSGGGDFFDEGDYEYDGPARTVTTFHIDLQFMGKPLNILNESR